MKVIIFSGYAISHLFPLKSTIEHLQKENMDIYLFGTSQNKWYGSVLKVKYIEYSENYWKPILKKEANKYNEIIEQFHKDNKIEDMLYNILKKDALLAFNHNKNVMSNIRNKIEEIRPDMVFRDSTDIYWNHLKYEFPRIFTIGYITNNLYNWEYLGANLTDLSYFLGINDLIEKLPSHYLQNFKKKIDSIYKEIENEYLTFPLKAYYQYDPSEQFNIIYSTKALQPKNYYDIDKYIIIEPKKNELAYELKIDNKLKEFITDSKIIYISTGSFISRNMKYYQFLLSSLVQYDEYKIIISAGKLQGTLEEYVISKKMNKRVFIAKNIPQKYILNNCELFITSGGINSIKESLFYRVPMLVIPISCEQRLNGLIVEKLGVGYTTFGKNAVLENMNVYITKLFTSKKFKDNLKKISDQMKKSNNYESFECLIKVLGMHKHD